MNGNGSHKKKRRKLFIYGGIGLAIVLLIAVGVFAATRGGTKIDATKLANKKSFNIALLGVLSRHLDIAETAWLDAIRAALPEPLHAANLQAFELGRSSA